MATFGELIHGRKPEVAPFIPTDPLEMLKKLLTGEIKDWPQIQALGDLYQNYMVSGIENLFPNFSEVLGLGGADTQSLLSEAAPLIKGELPEDVKSQVLRSSAFQNLMGGGGDQFLQSLQGRDLGLTSLDLMKQGAGMLEAGGNAAQRWAGLASGTMMNPGSQLYSPEWYSEFIAKQNAAKQATKQMQFNVDAAPDPAWADRAAMFANILGMAAGGGMGGGGGLGSSVSTHYSSDFGGGGKAGTTPFPTGNYGYTQPSSNNPGFMQNFLNAQNAQPGTTPVGVGGWLGSFFNQQPGY